MSKSKKIEVIDGELVELHVAEDNRPSEVVDDNIIYIRDAKEAGKWGEDPLFVGYIYNLPRKLDGEWAITIKSQEEDKFYTEVSLGGEQKVKREVKFI